MSEKFPAGERSAPKAPRDETVRRVTSSGMIIECQTKGERDPKVDKIIGEMLRDDVYASTSMWHFMGEDNDRIAKGLTKAANMVIDRDPDTRGRFKAVNVNGTMQYTDRSSGWTSQRPFSGMAFAGYADRTSPDEVQASSYRVVGELNKLLDDADMGFQLPLPTRVQENASQPNAANQ